MKNLFGLTDEEEIILQNAQTYSDCLPPVIRILQEKKKSGRPIHMVGFALTTGGTTIQENMALAKKAIRFFENLGLNVFNQFVWEDCFDRIAKERRESGIVKDDEYDTPLIDDTYGELIKIDLINAVNFLPNYKSSKGALREEKHALTYGREIYYVTDDELQLIRNTN